MAFAMPALLPRCHLGGGGEKPCLLLIPCVKNSVFHRGAGEGAGSRAWRRGRGGIRAGVGSHPAKWGGSALLWRRGLLVLEQPAWM